MASASLAAGRQLAARASARPAGGFQRGPDGEIAAGLPPAISVELPGLCRPDARQQAPASARPATTSRRVLGQPQEGHQVLHVGRLHELQPAVLVKGDVAAAPARPPGACCGATRGTAPPAAARSIPASRWSRICRMTKSACSSSSSQVTSTGRSPSPRSRPEVLGDSARGQADHAGWWRRGSAACCDSSAPA